MRQLRPYIYFGLCVCFMWGTLACEDKPPAPPPKPKVVAKKINPAPAPKKTQAPKKKAPAPKPKAAPPAPTPVAAPPPAKAAAPAAATPAAPAGSTIESLRASASADGNSIYRARYYNPEGKIDPFAPLFKEQKKPTPAAKKKKKKRRVPQTPLERIGLGQLKLVGVIQMDRGSRAIVQEATGKGYVVREGTYIGLNSGKVVAIQSDRIIIEEEVENVLGKVTARKQELKLQKPLGE